MLTTKHLLDDIFNSLTTEFLSDSVHVCNLSMNAVSTKSNSDGQEIKIVVPGYGKDDLNVEFSGCGHYILVKSKDGKINKSLRLLNLSSLDTSNVKAKCLNGILSINIPYKKVEHSKNKIVIE